MQIFLLSCCSARNAQLWFLCTLLALKAVSAFCNRCMHANKKNSNGVHFGGCTWIFFFNSTWLFASQSSLWLSKKRAHSNFRLWYMPLEVPHLHLVVSKTFWRLRDDLFMYSFSSVRCCTSQCCNYLSRPFNHYFQGIGEGWQKRQICVYSQPLNSCCSVKKTKKWSFECVACMLISNDYIMHDSSLHRPKTTFFHNECCLHTTRGPHWNSIAITQRHATDVNYITI